MTPDFPVVREGRALLRASLAASLAGLALTAIRGHFAPRIALAAYLVAFTYWVGLALGALALLMAFHAARARWMITVRRPLEAIAASITVFPLLFVPIALGVRSLFPWAGSTAGLDEETAHLIHHRAPYLNPTFFVIRAAIYFTVWTIFARLFLRWSTRQDTSGAPDLTVKAWRLGAGGLPALGLTLTFAAIDWLMSLGVRWYSTIWGVYYFAGSFIGAIALLIVAVFLLARTPALHDAVRPAHWLSLGKLLLAFICFWAYIAFSQYMLVWIGNLPDTIPWLLLRQDHAWRWIGATLILGHFVVPFLLLLSHRQKLEPQRLAPVALWILAIHYLDLYWLVIPQVQPGSIVPDWSNLTAFVGVGGAAIATGLFLLRGHHAIPVRDPFLAESLGYSRTQ
jgi:hypothetical protein